MVAYSFAYNYAVTQIDNKIQGDDREEPDVKVETISSESKSMDNDEEEEKVEDEEALNTGYLSD